MDRAKILAEFREIISKPQNDYIREWIRNGGKVVGYFCTFVPAELFSAAGILPIRIRGAGSKDSGSADAYLSNRVCTFIRHATALALDKQYDFLEGEVSLNTCDHVRRACDVWRLKTRIPFHAFISVPRNTRESLFPWYLEEVQALKNKVEEHFGVRITNNNLRQAISVHNEVRRRLIQLNQLRRRDPSPLNGEEMLCASVASRLMPCDKFLPMADALIASLENYHPLERTRARIILIGGALDEPEFIHAVESQGTQIVGDNTCFVARYTKQLIPEDGDLESMCRHYFFNVSCARMIGGFPQRLEDVQRLLRETKADGVIFQKIKFCDPWASDGHGLIRRFKHMGKPLLMLERECGITATGQIKTRTQAFLEALGK